MDIKDIKYRILFFRNKNNLSAREVSLRIGKNKGYINKLESQNFNLSTKALLDIINALEITPEEFFSPNYTSYQLDKSLNEIILRLPKDKKKLLIDFLNTKG